MKESYIGYATDFTIRKKATSGGIGSAILKYLFDNQIIKTSITFDYDNNTLQYKPRLIYNYNDYNITGSIYHEIKLIQFIKEHINEIKGGFACFVLPCQALAIRTILHKANIYSFLIGLTCSSQQQIEATHYLLKRLHIHPKNIFYIQYRGNGWPSGIQITLKNKTTKFIPNNNSIWTQIFHSRLFIQKRCFNCKNTLNYYSDITLADPWLNEYINESIGKSLIVINSIEGKKYIEEAKESYIHIDKINFYKVLLSQEKTIKRKESFLYCKRAVSLYRKIITNNLYKYIITNINSLFNIHTRIKNKIEKQILQEYENSNN